MDKILNNKESAINQYENFFITLFDNATSKNTTYLKIPNCNTFTNCIKEILHSLKLEIDGKVKTEHSKKLIENFYNLMLNDIVFRDVNYLEYSRLLLSLKAFSEGDSTGKLDKYSYFEYLNTRFSWKYRKSVLDKIKEKWKLAEKHDDEYFFDSYDTQLVYIFINELLACGINYLFLNFLVKLYKQQKFSSFEDFLDYMFWENKDSFDIFLPITTLNNKDKKLFEIKNQIIIITESKTYCKVYGNNIGDFYRLIKENITRIESLFNILRFYSNSVIDFVRTENIIVESKYFNETFLITFDDIIKYVGPTPYFKNLSPTIDSLNALKDKGTEEYHKILNTISYAEKDKDYMNPSSYVDNWIALETLMSMSIRKTGYEAVSTFVPIMLSARLILNDATNTLEQAYRNYNGKPMKLERFLNLIATGQFDYQKIRNPYYQLEVKRLMRIFSNIKSLQKEFIRVETLLKMDVQRIYMLRNEYVHASNLQAFNSVQQIKLKHILPSCIDEFFKLLNLRIERDVSKYGIIFDIFTEFITRYNNRMIAFKIINETCKLQHGAINLSTDLNSRGIEIDKFIFNILKNNVDLFKKYVPTEEYEG